MTLSNWAGNVEYRAGRLLEPRSIDELIEMVASKQQMRALGTSHSFNDLPDNGSTMVSTLRIDPAPELDGEVMTIGAGTRYAVAARFLHEHGRALPNMGSLPHISIGGAISTGTHGSGVQNRCLSASVVGLDLVGAGGERSRLTEGDPDFGGAIVSMGALGVFARVSIKTVEEYLIRQDVYTRLDWDVLLDRPRDVFGAGYSVSVFTTWDTAKVAQMWVKRRVASVDEAVPDDLLGARLDDDVTARIISEGGDNTTPFGVARPWLETLPHFRVDATPSSGDEIQSEYFVPIGYAGSAIAAVRELAGEIAPRLVMSELRTVAADDLWLSPASERDSLGLHFTWRNDTAEVLKVLPLIERALEPYGPRPHWGKVFTLAPEAIAARYPRMQQMRDLIQRRDPSGQFRGPLLDRLLDLG